MESFIHIANEYTSGAVTVRSMKVSYSLVL